METSWTLTELVSTIGVTNTVMIVGWFLWLKFGRRTNGKEKVMSSNGKCVEQDACEEKHKGVNARLKGIEAKQDTMIESLADIKGYIRGLVETSRIDHER